MTEKQLLVCAFSELHTSRHILERFFGARPDGTILFHNKYFMASVTLRILYEPEHGLLLSDEDWRRDLSRFPAVILLSSDQQSETISKCKTLWDSLRTVVGEDAIRILFLDGEDMDEKETYQLVEWGVSKNIEVVNTFLCREDDIDVSLRLNRILECAPWSSVSQNTSEDKEIDPKSHPKPLAQDELGKPDVSGNDLSNPTRLRRGLQNSDLTRLVGDLLLADDTDSDT